jgi:hypothetical protein
LLRGGVLVIRLLCEEMREGGTCVEICRGTVKMDGWTGRPCMTKALSVIFFYDGVFTERNVHKRMLPSKNYYCDPCGTNCSSQKDFNTHLATATHKNSDFISV